MSAEVAGRASALGLVHVEACAGERVPVVGRTERHPGAPQRLVGFLSLALVASLGTGCGAGAMLKEPIAGQCQSAGLKSCSDLADGVVLFIEGDEAKAQEKLVAAAAANSPDDLSQFVCALKAIEMIPGAGDYMGPVLKVVEIIEGAKDKTGEGKGDASGGSGADEAGASGTTGASAVRCPSRTVRGRVLTAATDPAHLRAGIAVPSGGGRSCDDFGVPADRCFRIRRGPFVVTDLQAPRECTMVVFSGEPTDDESPPSWAVSGALAIHGARLLVDEESVLMVGVSERDPGASCALLWGGFEPYERVAEAPEEL